MSSKYASSHVSPQGPGDARPTALQIIQDECLEGKLSDKVVLITGCSSGLGVETARALLATGATLYLAVRNPAKARATLGDMSQNDRVHLLTLDLNDLSSVRACAAEFATKSKTLNILINNAGVMATPEEKTADGFETQFGTNYLAHFLLSQLLNPILLASSTPESPSRLVNVSSSMHRACEVQFDNLNWTGNYDPWMAYGQSKTALVWMANEVERRYGSKGLHDFSLHPGGILSGLQKHQGAATTVWAAVSKDLEGLGGKYLEDCQIIGAWDPATGEIGPGYATWAYDQEKAEKLWPLGLKLVGLSDTD
ncbi:short-chain dehydrogenase [Colletotrichum phormii]|uniref:Short-chain dehydrogenase n=1 Tax=Colletotrichum phormii TaxID=359342 RepID=A0AAJ0E8F4_9PEZI|nr:short-chain dehydrogenase [Colletotrichum phormii]KAK1622799.1 short-chain dehydrogenase [Colletotrichum phormii]